MLSMKLGQLEGFERVVLGFYKGGIANPYGAQGEYYGCDWEGSLVDPPPLQTS